MHKSQLLMPASFQKNSIFKNGVWIIENDILILQDYQCVWKGPYLSACFPIGTFLDFWVPIYQGPYFQCYELLLIQQASNMLIIKIGELQNIPHMSFWVPIFAAAKGPF